MSAPTICTVSGLCRDSGGNALSGVTIVASSFRPYIHPTDNSLITPDAISTISASDGTWSLALVETTTPATSITVSFIYLAGSSGVSDRHEYTIIVPNAATAVFGTLLGTQV